MAIKPPDRPEKDREVSTTDQRGVQPKSGIWLEVHDVRAELPGSVEVCFVGDRNSREPEWWTVAQGALPTDSVSAMSGYRAIADSKDKKQLVLGRLGIPQNPSGKPELVCTAIRIQFGDSTRR